jgi:hypothetical protein
MINRRLAADSDHANRVSFFGIIGVAALRHNALALEHGGSHLSLRMLTTLGRLQRRGG